MEIDDRESDYKESNLRSSTRITARRLRAASDFSKRARTATRKDEIVFNGSRNQSSIPDDQHATHFSSFGGVSMHPNLLIVAPAA